MRTAISSKVDNRLSRCLVRRANIERANALHRYSLSHSPQTKFVKLYLLPHTPPPPSNGDATKPHASVPVPVPRLLSQVLV